MPAKWGGVEHLGEDLLSVHENKKTIDFENEGGELYICGNPPYLGTDGRTPEQNAEMKLIFDRNNIKKWRKLDYVASWFMKAAEYGQLAPVSAAFVSTNSICQGEQVPTLWPRIHEMGTKISFAYTSFKWKNLASDNAGVAVVIVGISSKESIKKKIYSDIQDENVTVAEVEDINAYLAPGKNIVVSPRLHAPSDRSQMRWGSKKADGGWLVLSYSDRNAIVEDCPNAADYIRPYTGASEYIRGKLSYCIWIEDKEFERAKNIHRLAERFDKVGQFRLSSRKKATRDAARFPYKFTEIGSVAKECAIIIPTINSENREYLPVGLLSSLPIVGASAFVIADAPLHNFAILSSKLHKVWISAVCGRLKTDLRYSNTLGWNTFPIPDLTRKMISDLTVCSEQILIARESHFPKTISELYDPANMPSNLQAAHDHCDEVFERIYLGRRFKNNTERLEKLFDLYASSLRGRVAEVDQTERLLQ